MEFRKVNLNPTGKPHSDCVVRAIAYALGQTWRRTYRELSKLGEELCDVLNVASTYEEYLRRKGQTRSKRPSKPNRTFYTVKEWAELHPEGTFILTTPAHLTVVENGCIVDSWNTASEKIVGGYWKIDTM